MRTLAAVQHSFCSWVCLLPSTHCSSNHKLSVTTFTHLQVIYCKYPNIPRSRARVGLVRESILDLRGKHLLNMYNIQDSKLDVTYLPALLWEDNVSALAPLCSGLRVMPLSRSWRPPNYTFITLMNVRLMDCFNIYVLCFQQNPFVANSHLCAVTCLVLRWKHSDTGLTCHAW